MLNKNRFHREEEGVGDLFIHRALLTSPFRSRPLFSLTWKFTQNIGYFQNTGKLLYSNHYPPHLAKSPQKNWEHS